MCFLLVHALFSLDGDLDGKVLNECEYVFQSLQSNTLRSPSDISTYDMILFVSSGTACSSWGLTFKADSCPTYQKYRLSYTGVLPGLLEKARCLDLSNPPLIPHDYL